MQSQAIGLFYDLEEAQIEQQSSNRTTCRSNLRDLNADYQFAWFKLRFKLHTVVVKSCHVRSTIL